jgi:hypothetical protein
MVRTCSYEGSPAYIVQCPHCRACGAVCATSEIAKDNWNDTVPARGARPRKDPPSEEFENLVRSVDVLRTEVHDLRAKVDAKDKAVPEPAPRCETCANLWRYDPNDQSKTSCAQGVTFMRGTCGKWQDKAVPEGYIATEYGLIKDPFYEKDASGKVLDPNRNTKKDMLVARAVVDLQLWAARGSKRKAVVVIGPRVMSVLLREGSLRVATVTGEESDTLDYLVDLALDPFAE